MPVSEPADLPRGGGGRWPSAASGFRSAVDDRDRVVAVDEVRSSKTVADKLRFVVTIEGPSGTRTRPWLAPRVATMASMFPPGYLQELLDDGRGPHDHDTFARLGI